jgi:Ca2+-binding EF-hand superfamily protein
MHSHLEVQIYMSSPFPDDWMQEAFQIPGLDQGEFDHKTLEEVFREIDADNKGHVNRADVRRLMTLVGEKVDEVDIDEMMRLMDPENTGSITLEQFVDSFMYPSALFFNQLE